MTIKQQGGIFGRNPTFNNVEVDGSISGDGQIDFSTGPTVAEGAILKEHSLLLFTDQETAGASSDIKGVEIVSPTTTRVIFHSTNAGGRKYGLYTSTNGEFALYDYTAGATRWEVNSAGNLAFPAGNGIDFSATSGTGTSELFDDYEEGTWTPTWDNVTIGNGSTSGTYTKVGRLVYVSAILTFGSTTSISGNMTFSGLPYTSGAFRQFGLGNILDSGTANNLCRVQINESAATGQIQAIPASSTYAQGTIANATTPMTWTSGDDVRFSISYYV